MPKDSEEEEIFNVSDTEANADWMRAVRLQMKAEAGDDEARKELEKMKVTPTYEMEWDI